MSAQILLQGRLLGAEAFLPAPPANRENRAFEARLEWLSLLGELLPRALLAHLQLPPLLLGASGGGHFLLILPDRPRADEAASFLSKAAAVLGKLTSGMMRIVWSTTENLGDWTVVRKRLNDGMAEASGPAAPPPGYFDPFDAMNEVGGAIPRDLRDAPSLAWSFDFPALIQAGAGFSRSDLGPQAVHTARNGDAPASTRELARRSRGQKLWGVLRGAIDDHPTRLRRAQSVEEYVQLSMLYRQFLAGELELLCSQSEYFQRVSVLHAGAADFVVCGSWDALAGFARELQRVFALFAEGNLKNMAGAEARTITMSLTLAGPAEPLARVWEDSLRDLETARATDKDCLYILGRVLEWKQLNDAADLKEAIIQLNEEFSGGRQFLGQLRNLYKKVEAPDHAPGRGDQDRLVARAIRFQRRFARVATRKEREFQKLRAHLMKELSGRGLRGRLRLRPEGLVALEWARLAEDS